MLNKVNHSWKRRTAWEFAATAFDNAETSSDNMGKSPADTDAHSWDKSVLTFLLFAKTEGREPHAENEEVKCDLFLQPAD